MPCRRRHAPSRGSQGRLASYGIEQHGWKDPYHSALNIPWWGFLLVATCVYLAANLFFAGLDLLPEGVIADVGPRDFAGAFFFSVQTMATRARTDPAAINPPAKTPPSASPDSARSCRP